MNKTVEAHVETAPPEQRLTGLSMLLLCVSVLLVFTLRPFHFVYPPKAWDFDFFPRDLFQNVILFLPFGMILRRYFSLGMIFLLGALLSFGIEYLQLYTPTRWSNPFDIACNASGALLGALIADFAFRNRPHRLHEFMVSLVLLCWVTAAAVNGDPLSRYAIPFLSAAGIVAFSVNVQSSFRQWATMLFWSGFTSAFYFYTLRHFGVIFLALVIGVNWLFIRATNRDNDTLRGLTLIGGLLLLAAFVLRLALRPWNWNLSLHLLQLLLFINLICTLKKLPHPAPSHPQTALSL